MNMRWNRSAGSGCSNAEAMSDGAAQLRTEEDIPCGCCDGRPDPLERAVNNDVVMSRCPVSSVLSLLMA